MTAITVSFGGQDILVEYGENTTEAAQYSADAAASAAAAEAAAAEAEGIIGTLSPIVIGMLAAGAVQTVGNTPLELGSGFNAGTYALGTAASARSIIKSIAVHAGAAGTLTLLRFSKVGDLFTREEVIAALEIPSAGAYELTTDDFGLIEVEAGDHLGWWTATNDLVRYSGSGVSQWYGTSTPDAASFTVSTVGPEKVQMNFELAAYPTEGYWSGKTGVLFGDSITWQDGRAYGVSHVDSGDIAVGWQSHLRATLGCLTDNQALSARTMAELWADAIDTYSFVGKDFAWFTAGANDWREDLTSGSAIGVIAAIGGTFDTATYFGALQASIEKALADNPTILIFLATPIRGWYFEEGTGDVPNPAAENTMLPETYANAVKAVGALYGLPVVDWYNLALLNDLNRFDLLGDNPGDPEDPDYPNIPYLLHPRDNLYRIMGSLAVDKMRAYGR